MDIAYSLYCFGVANAGRPISDSDLKIVGELGSGITGTVSLAVYEPEMSLVAVKVSSSNGQNTHYIARHLTLI